MRMVISIEVAGNLVQCKAMEISLIQIDLLIKEIGRTEKKVAKVYLLTQMEIIKMEFGPMINFNLAQSK